MFGEYVVKSVVERTAPSICTGKPTPGLWDGNRTHDLPVTMPMASATRTDVLRTADGKFLSYW